MQTRDHEEVPRERASIEGKREVHFGLINAFALVLRLPDQMAFVVHSPSLAHLVGDVVFPGPC